MNYYTIIILLLSLCFLQAKTRSRIVGGDEADIINYPYQVFILIDNTYCGGSIITEKYILTASHCVLHYSYRPDLISVWTNSSIALTGGATHSIKQVHVHPQYDDYTTDYDVAVLELTSPLTLGIGVNIVKLPNEKNQNSPHSELVEGALMTISGWGAKQGENPTFEKQLRAVNISLINNNKCANIYSKTDFIITDRMICAISTDEQHRGACTGDSGGPVVKNNVQYGIVSWSEGGCADSGYPSVLTNVLAVRDFLRNITGV